MTHEAKGVRERVAEIVLEAMWDFSPGTPTEKAERFADRILAALAPTETPQTKYVESLLHDVSQFECDCVEGDYCVACRVRDELGNYLDLLRAAPTESEGERIAEWRPIETAPIGVDVVVVGRIPSGSRLRACVSRYYADRDDSPFLIEGWAYSAPGFVHSIEPTHWMPLPAPPESNEEMEDFR